MPSAAEELRQKSWSRDGFYISTDASLIPIPDLTDAFASKDFYWASPPPAPVLKETLENSLCFGLYETGGTTINTQDTSISQRAYKFIGIARCVTDFTTFLYLTDVWVNPTYQGKGLGAWLITCVQEVIESMPYLRRSILMTADWKRSVPFYTKLMGMEVCELQHGEGLAIMERKGMGHPGYGKQGSGYNLD